jgi:hypothetical protein
MPLRQIIEMAMRFSPGGRELTRYEVELELRKRFWRE